MEFSYPTPQQMNKESMFIFTFSYYIFLLYANLLLDEHPTPLDGLIVLLGVLPK